MAYQLQFDVAGVNPDRAVVHADESFFVQWKAQNLGPDDTGDFVDHLVVTDVGECPGSDDEDHPVMYDSADEDDLSPFAEPPQAAGQVGPLIEAEVGPFPAGAYRLAVTLDDGGPNPVTIFNCIEITEAV
jgi:hypothetical protein